MVVAAPKQVLIVDDHEHLAAALELLLSGDPRFQVCGVARDVSEALSAMPGASPDLVIVDVNLSGGSGLDLIPKLRDINPAARCLVFSQEDPRGFASTARKAGANGYLRKGATADAILEGASIVATGGEYFPDGEER